MRMVLDPHAYGRGCRIVGARLLVAACLAASGCAASYEPVAPGAVVAEAPYEGALADCRERAEQAGLGETTLLGAVAGVFYGAAQGAVSGAVWGGNSAEGAAIGAAAGLVVGAALGATADSAEYAKSMDACMAAKGYRPT